MSHYTDQPLASGLQRRHQRLGERLIGREQGREMSANSLPLGQGDAVLKQLTIKRET